MSRKVVLESPFYDEEDEELYRYVSSRIEDYEEENDLIDSLDFQSEIQPINTPSTKKTSGPPVKGDEKQRFERQNVTSTGHQGHNAGPTLTPITPEEDEYDTGSVVDSLDFSDKDGDGWMSDSLDAETLTSPKTRDSLERSAAAQTLHQKPVASTVGHVPPPQSQPVKPQQQRQQQPAQRSRPSRDDPPTPAPRSARTVDSSGRSTPITPVTPITPFSKSSRIPVRAQPEAGHSTRPPSSRQAHGSVPAATRPEVEWQAQNGDLFEDFQELPVSNYSTWYGQGPREAPSPPAPAAQKAKPTGATRDPSKTQAKQDDSHRDHERTRAKQAPPAAPAVVIASKERRAKPEESPPVIADHPSHAPAERHHIGGEEFSDVWERHVQQLKKRWESTNKKAKSKPVKALPPAPQREERAAPAVAPRGAAQAQTSFKDIQRAFQQPVQPRAEDEPDHISKNIESLKAKDQGRSYRSMYQKTKDNHSKPPLPPQRKAALGQQKPQSAESRMEGAETVVRRRDESPHPVRKYPSDPRLNQSPVPQRLSPMRRTPSLGHETDGTSNSTRYQQARAQQWQPSPRNVRVDYDLHLVGLDSESEDRDRSSSLSRHHPLPPIHRKANSYESLLSGAPSRFTADDSGQGSPSSVHKGSYLAEHKKTKNPKKTNYKPYTLEDYKKLHLDMKLGGLGANTANEEVQEKNDKVKQRKKYGKVISQQNRKRIEESQRVNMFKPSDQPAEQEPPSKTELAKNYARQVPKPKVRREVEHQPLELPPPSAMSYESYGHDAREEFDLMRLAERHRLERDRAESIRRQFQLPQTGNV